MRICLIVIALGCAFGPATSGAQDAYLGRNLAATCANCHGTNGQAVAPMVSLAGMKPEALVAALAEFKSGTRGATIMHQISKGYSDEQVKLIAAYFAAQPVRP